MNYVEQFQTKSKEDAAKTVSDVLTSRAMETLNSLQESPKTVETSNTEGE